MLNKITTPLNSDLSQFCNQFVMSEKAKSLLINHNDLDSFMNELIQQQYYSDVILLIIYRLNQKQAIHWACAATHYGENPLNEQDQSALDAITSWLQTPSKENHLNTLNSAPINVPGSVSWAAIAAYWAGCEDTEARENTMGSLIKDAVYSSIMLSIFQTSANQQELIYKNAINDGMALLG